MLKIGVMFIFYKDGVETLKRIKECYDGIFIKPENVKDDRVKKLYESHIRFCERIKNMLV